MTRMLAMAFLLLMGFASLAQQETPPTVLSEDSVQALLIHKVAPVYPPLARQARIQGTVILKIVINKDGDVRDVQLYSGHPMLAPAAIEAVKQWNYQPYTKDGEVVEVSTMVRVNFNMPGGPAPKDEPANVPLGSMSGVIGQVMSSGASASRVSEGVYRVPESEMRNRRMQKVDVVYPPTAIQEGIQGTIALEVQILPSGDVDDVRSISGDPILVQAAMEAVRQWKYRPYVIEGNAVTVITLARFNFALTENGTGGVVTEALVTQPQRVRVSSGVSQGLLVNKVAPVYPVEARQVHIPGTVILQARIDKEGNVVSLELISGHPMLAPAAIEAVRQWKYRPYLLNGNAVEVETQVQVNFVLQ